MPQRVRELLEEVGDNPVLKIQLGRTPVLAVLVLFLNLASSWKFSDKQLALGYDEIYHNYLLVTIQNNKKTNVLHTMVHNSKDTIPSTVYKLEKAHRVRLMKPVFPTEFVDLYDIPLTRNRMFTLNRLITTASNIDKHFYTYDAGNNNMCQTFVENIVDINGLIANIVDNATRIALKPQDAKALVATLGSRSDIVKRITDLGGKLDKWVFDRKIIWKKPMKKEFALIGNMQVKVLDETSTNNADDLLSSSFDNTALNGMVDTIIENTDDAFNAVLAMEENEKKAKQKRLIIIIISILIAIVLIGAAVAVGYFIWRKRNSTLNLCSMWSSIKILHTLFRRENAIGNRYFVFFCFLDQFKKKDLIDDVNDKTKIRSSISEATDTNVDP
ncbi:unnamed protein product [Rotaria magnacalcarata]|uniref:Uncharacterized protein n=1 Tax=Rotaria magnacalcarata TaxID=392030 RepID=A0A819TKX3_9BILA|nr:unnamed protein product [Rotaria magnacalcarata]CAF2098948.1 unnamed protein product [Rotaria magnacalcarata]CAF4025633.1 unnamed protein product [Rotaria magnacalcarata]CAF4079499.1 unnamed protein product [Rotaria magnacalcarata]